MPFHVHGVWRSSTEVMIATCLCLVLVMCKWKVEINTLFQLNLPIFCWYVSQASLKAQRQKKNEIINYRTKWIDSAVLALSAFSINTAFFTTDYQYKKRVLIISWCRTAWNCQCSAWVADISFGHCSHKKTFSFCLQNNIRFPFPLWTPYYIFNYEARYILWNTSNFTRCTHRTF